MNLFEETLKKWQIKNKITTAQEERNNVSEVTCDPNYSFSYPHLFFFQNTITIDNSYGVSKRIIAIGIRKAIVQLYFNKPILESQRAYWMQLLRKPREKGS